MSNSKTVLDPIEFRHLTVKNRVFRSSVTGRWDNYDGSGNQARVNWENKFAKGGVGAIISSYVPVSIEGRITPQVSTIHADRLIPFWKTIGETVRQHGCKYIIQLSHSGRQRDIEGVENTTIDPRSKAIQPKPAPSTTGQADQINGLPANLMSLAEVENIVRDFASAAGRAKEAGLDGIELHSSHGYLINQFLSAGINRRTDKYGGDLKGRYQFLKEIVGAVRNVVGSDFHFQAKISIREYNNIIPPWGHAGNSVDDSLQICQWLEEDGIDAIHVSRGSTFPHPLLPSGPFPFEMLRYTYDTMVSSGGFASFRNFLLFRYRFLRPLFQLLWNRLPKKVGSKYKQPFSGNEITSDMLDKFFQEHVSAEEVNALLQRHQGTVLRDAKAVKEVLQEIPIITTGGFQQASFINKAIQEGYTDAVSMARMLVANNDLVNNYFAKGLDISDRPCTYCNECLGAYLELPVGCHTIDRFYQRSVQGLSQADACEAAQEALKAKNDEVMSVFEPTAKVFVPSHADGGD
ncbi:NADH:flavin oxidoreductase [Synechococcus sp. PCC 7336]|uniref:NADH:flavin oxidoreductase n=1 Tax=Synechococcus sp. PCC 7336 TaxID=195250 RepID=UPI0003684C13|nr:NADH:flavin oxidoreductase [Synechococcus sp. PCC 7336]